MLLTKVGSNFSLRKSPSKSKSIQYFLQSVGSFGQAVSEETNFQKLTNQKQGLHATFMFLNVSEQNEHLQRGPSVDASYKVSVHLAKWFQRRRFFRNRPIRNKNCLWRPCLLIDLSKFCNLYRGPSIDASYQVSVHLAKWFQRRRLKCEKLMDDRRSDAK